MQITYNSDRVICSLHDNGGVLSFHVFIEIFMRGNDDAKLA